MIRFEVPLPPPSLRANSRAHWSKKKSDADEYSEDVYAYFVGSVGNLNPAPSVMTMAVYGANVQYIARQMSEAGFPWSAAHVHYEWHHAGVAPDHGNLGGNTKYLQDILCMAPKNAKPGYKRWHLGIVEDDAGIVAAYEAVKCAKRADEKVIITITEVEP